MSMSYNDHYYSDRFENLSRPPYDLRAGRSRGYESRGPYTTYELHDFRRYEEVPPPLHWYDHPYDIPLYDDIRRPMRDMYSRGPEQFAPESNKFVPKPAKKAAKNAHLYKTELCSQWLARGCCPYNQRCRFAHGPQELRPVTRDANYR